MSPKVQDLQAKAEADAPDLGLLRERVLAAPETILEDPEIMAALLAPSEADGRKIVDLRAAQIDRLEQRLVKLRRAHRDVVEAALDSMNGVEQAHQAALALMERDCSESLATRIRTRLPRLLNLDEARLCLCLDDPSSGASLRQELFEAQQKKQRRRSWSEALRRRMAAMLAPETVEDAAPEENAADRDPLDPALLLLPEDTIMSRCPQLPPRPASRRRSGGPGPGRPVAIRVREVALEDRIFFGPAVDRLEMMAAITLDLRPERCAGALIFGADDGDKLKNGALIESLAFLGGVVERLVLADDAARVRPAPALRVAGREAQR